MISDPKPNQPVRLISNPSVWGVLTGRTKNFGPTIYFEVETDRNERRYIAQVDLVPHTTDPTGIEDLLSSLKFGTIGDLARILTYHKISSNLSNVFYAMQASRTDFHAYQFKSVYKYIESFNNRILIADEVGLGKTIEAGLIWLEAQARTKAKRLLVVCPSMLRDKWKKELRFRFNTRAEIYDSKGLRELLNDLKREGTGYQCAAVCSLNTVRTDSVREALADLENTPYRFDLVVIDEAHHMRNVGTKSQAVGHTLSDVTEAMVMLTATPIHLGSQDLYRLLNVLDSDQFEELWQFDQLIYENEPIVLAQNSLRRQPPRIDEAREQLQILTGYRSFANNTHLEQALAKLDQLDPARHEEMVEIGLLLEKMNLLSSHISRTRKREVIEWRVRRESQSLAVTFTEQEAAFYQSVTQAVQDRIERFSESQVAAFALMMPQRQMASCIPAMVEHYRSEALISTEFDGDLLEGLGIYEEGGEEQREVNSWPALDQVVDSWNAGTTDSKFDVLVEALRERFQLEPEVKIIIFSYFKKTLKYLNTRLTQAGFGPVMIHGDIPMEERQELIDLFQSRSERRVLLSSEVGAEGIDLQFCRVIFNYDLPWNPMKVEQRIGRIDRLGQKAEKISIVNFAVENTIEEKILNRLYARIGIFEKSLGDLEPILGELTQQLSFDLLSHRLTPEQEIERIEQTRLAAENRRQQEDELAEQSSVFLGSSDYILEQIGAARELGRRVTPDDLRRFIQDFFENADYHGSTVKWNEPDQGLVTIKLSNKANSALSWFCRQQNPPLSTYLVSGEPQILVLDPVLAQTQPQTELLTHFHPLIQWIRECHRENSSAFFPTSAVELKSDLFPPGDYVIAIHFWTFAGLKRSKRVEYEISPLNGTYAGEQMDGERLLKEMIERGSTWEYAALKIDREGLRRAWDECSNRILERYEAAFEVFNNDNDNLKERRRLHLEAYSRRKEETWQRAIHTMREKNMPESKMRGFYKMIENRQRQTMEEQAKLKMESVVSKEFKEVAAVVCRIT